MKFRFAIFLCCLFFISACGVRSAGHLPRLPWATEVSHTLQMRYMSITYETEELPNNTLRIQGEAYPEVQTLPEWASWYGETLITAYITDANGVVLGESQTTLPAQILQREACLPITAVFELGTSRLQPLFVTFGYRVMFADGSPEDASRRWLASEDVLDK